VVRRVSLDLQYYLRQPLRQARAAVQQQALALEKPHHFLLLPVFKARHRRS
jgi:hypothetical protein